MIFKILDKIKIRLILRWLKRENDNVVLINLDQLNESLYFSHVVNKAGTTKEGFRSFLKHISIFYVDRK